MLDSGFVDCFRHLHPTIQAFSYFGYRTADARVSYLLVKFDFGSRGVKSVCVPVSTAAVAYLRLHLTSAPFSQSRNIGWRLDYFLVSPALLPRLRMCDIRKSVEGSDHVPIVLELAPPSSLADE